MRADNSDFFYKNVYGIEMKRHILPFNVHKLSWTGEQMKEYRKKIPNYVVVLVNKVLDTA